MGVYLNHFRYTSNGLGDSDETFQSLRFAYDKRSCPRDFGHKVFANEWGFFLNCLIPPGKIVFHLSPLGLVLIGAIHDQLKAVLSE